MEAVHILRRIDGGEHLVDDAGEAGVVSPGPEGGDGGGEIVAEGTPEDIVAADRSYTGQFLRDLLERRPVKRIEAAE